MYQNGGRLLFLYALSPVHPGAGTGAGAVDLPVQREAGTGLPMIQHSGLKGALRADATDRSLDTAQIGTVFGPPPGAGSPAAGALGVSDARLLLLPVRAPHGPFAWVTSPWVLQRLARDLRTLGGDGTALPAIGAIGPESAWVSRLCPLCMPAGNGRERLVLGPDGEIYAAERRAEVDELACWLSARVMPQNDAAWAYFRKLLCEPEDGGGQKRSHLVLVSDEAFAHWCRQALDVRTRVQLDGDARTVAQGPWVEEYLPAESLLYAILVARDPRVGADPSDAQGVLGWMDQNFDGRCMRLGGNETLAAGWLQLRSFCPPQGASRVGLPSGPVPADGTADPPT